MIAFFGVLFVVFSLGPEQGGVESEWLTTCEEVYNFSNPHECVAVLWDAGRVVDELDFTLEDGLMSCAASADSQFAYDQCEMALRHAIRTLSR
ncbi:hypothetical protein [Gymnodinialimonas hymeniacidonis]|uniref:hypothetical protein n=1 Tax=Gymnodinialimonas hymeniacidonis TaxID=3126508 RepID=UPI0034C6A498